MKIFGQTLSICSTCSKKIEARIETGDSAETSNNVYLNKFCPEHGTEKVLISSDADWYEQSRFYSKPGQEPLARQNSEWKGCPDSCGMCDNHMQHTCLPIIEINTICNMDCPICLKTVNSEFDLSIEEFEKTIDTLITAEGHVPVINISGGEPTMHPLLAEFITLAKAKAVLQVTVSTNGLLFLEDENLTKLFKDTGSIVALQFDGFEPETFIKLRGEDFSAKKLEIIKHLEANDIKYSLVATVATTINSHEITKITEFFFNRKALSLMFQPATLTGNAKDMDYEKHALTIPDVVKEIEKSDQCQEGDFNPLPCSHYSCFALSYYLDMEDGNYRSLKSIMGKERYLDIIANKTLPGADAEGFDKLKEMVYDMWSAADSSDDTQAVLKRVKRLLLEMQSTTKVGEQSLDIGYNSMKGIFIHHFMDKHNMDIGRLMKCCNPYVKPDGNLVPMCRENVWC